MAQHQFDNRYKHRKGIPISPTSRKNTMMQKNAVSHSPNRSIPKVDRKDRQQQSDTASVASTVKISNVATPSPIQKAIPIDDSKSIMKLGRPSNIKSILESRDDSHCSGHNVNFNKRPDGYQRNPLLTPATSTEAIDEAKNIGKEIFLLLTLEGLSSNDFIRIIADQRFIHPKLQLQLAGDRNQPITNTRLRSFWNDLTTDEYNQISNSFFYHMRFKEKRARPFHIQAIKSFFTRCRFPPHRSTRENTLPEHESTHVPSSIPFTISRPTTISSGSNDRSMDTPADTSALNDVPGHDAIESEMNHIQPMSSSHVSSLESGAQVSTTTGVQNGADKILSIANPTPSSPDRKQEQDPILILLDIVDNASVNSSSTNGYATSMTSSIGSNSNMSRSYRHYNTFENRFHHRISNANHQNPSNPNNTTPVHSSYATMSTSTSFNSNYQTTNTNDNVIDSYSQSSKQHHRHQYDLDNDSTTSSNTGYISTMSNGHISISGSVASV